jgi:hypothetical protein
MEEVDEENLEEEKEQDAVAGDAANSPTLERVRGRFRWRRERKGKSRTPCRKGLEDCPCCQGTCDCLEELRKAQEESPPGKRVKTACCRACSCCRDECECPGLLACKHYRQVPSGMDWEQLVLILSSTRPADYEEPRRPPRPARNAILHAARVAVMAKRQALGQGLRHPDDAHHKGIERLGILADMLGITAEQDQAVTETVVEDHSPQENPEEERERTREEILKEALNHGRAVAARLEARNQM